MEPMRSPSAVEDAPADDLFLDGLPRTFD
jgi:hypothetical protein